MASLWAKPLPAQSAERRQNFVVACSISIFASQPANGGVNGWLCFRLRSAHSKKHLRDHGIRYAGIMQDQTPLFHSLLVIRRRSGSWLVKVKTKRKRQV
ncbi:MAG: hypothetical protein EBT61_20650 [Verrucomicrobia bacterium]|nr:hypothetical protein [Verrucomicrobiota bacterium]